MTATSTQAAPLMPFGAPLTDGAPFPLAPLQEGMFVHHTRGERPGIDIEQIVVASAEAFDVVALEAAWNDVVAAHPMLRTWVQWRDVDEPQQRIRSAVHVTIDVHDLSGRGDTATVVAEYLAADRVRGIALDEPPLMRLALLRLAAEDWRLVWTFHHILLDGRAFAVILEDVFARYDDGAIETRARGSYDDYVAWTHKRDASADDEFWRDTLRGFVARTPVPLRDGTLVGHAHATTADCDRRLDAETTRALEALATRERVSVGTLVQAAWALLLGHHGATDDVVFGAVVACGDYAPAREEHDALGLFVNTVPLRVPVRTQATVSEWLQGVRSQWRAAREHKHTPLVRIRSCSEMTGSGPLFDTIVMFEQYELEERLRARGGAWSRRGVRLYEQNGFAVTVAAFAGTRLLLRLEFDPAQLSADAARMLCDRLAAVLASMASQPDARVADVEMWLPGERDRVLREWNDTARAYAPETLDSLLRAQMRATPDATAVVAGDATLTYAALDAHADALGSDLIDRGVGAGAMVGVCIERSLELVIALVAVIRSGAAYVPLDPEYPLDRLAFMVEDSGVGIVLTSAELRERIAALPVTAAPTLVIVDRAARPVGTIAKPSRASTRDDPAYMIYTSGSTGRPKGALNAHGAIANRLQWMQAAYRLTAADAVLQKTPASFDVSVWEFFWPLVTGARLVMAAPSGHRDPAYLRDVIRSQRITVLHFVPSMLRAFLDEPEIETSAVARGGTLRDVVCSGEALPVDLQREFFARLPGVRLHNLYGPTEAAVDVTAWECDATGTRSTVPIGRPIANTSIYILDAAGRPVPIGVPGELYIGGVQVGQGYWRRPELTAERFVDDPLSDRDGARMYRTGDLARWAPDGVVEYLGRVDDQVKIRGQRVELGEIEAALVAEPEVRSAAAAVRTDARGSSQLVAYCVPASGTERNPSAAAQLRARLAKTLPSHMVPAAIVWIDALPLGVTGKLDRRALPAVDLAELVCDEPRAHIAPRSDAEAIIAEIFAETLGVPRIGMDQSFFDVGGDSILLIRAIARARRAGFEITLREVFAHPTVESLAAVATRSASMARVTRGDDVRAALTPIQRWFFDGIAEGRDHWNQSVLLRMRTRCDVERLRGALERVVDHHAALRSRFTRDGESWYQEPGSAVIDVDVADLTGRGRDVGALLRRVATAANESLSLADGRVIAVRAIRTEDHDLVLLVAHHAVVDGVSWRTIVDDLERAYNPDRSKTELEASATSFSEWSHALAELATSGKFSSQRGYWSRVAAGTRPLRRDAAPLGPSIAANTRTIVGTLGSAETHSLLRDVARAFGVHINDVLLAALGAALAPRVDAPSFVVDLEGHGREDVTDGVDVSRTVGWFTSLYPVALVTDTSVPIVERLRVTRDRLRTVPDRGIGYGVLRHLAGETTIAGTPRDVVFNYLGQLDRPESESREFTEIPARGIGELRSLRSARLHLVEFNCAVVAGCFEIAADFDATVIAASTIDGIVERFLSALRALIAASRDATGAMGDTRDTFDVESTYRATPLQRLFHVYADAADDPGLQQWRFTIHGRLQTDSLRDAWQAVIDRHAILRTEISNNDGDIQQVVRRHAVTPWNEVDLRACAPEDRDSALREIVARDRAASISVSRAPLMRLTLVRLADAEYELVWTHHHAILDRWSWPLVLRDVGAAYDALTAGRSPRVPRRLPFAAYVEWLSSRDSGRSETFWRAHFAGIDTPRRLAAPRSEGGSGSHVAKLDLTEPRMRSLRARAGACGVSFNAIIQCALALALAHVLGVDDVTLGIVASGRPDDLTGADEMIGPTIANVPLRIRIDSAASVDAWVRSCAERQIELQEHAWLAPDRIADLSGIRGAAFQTLTVFHHAGDDAVARDWLGAHASIVAVDMPTHTEWPVTVVIAGDREMRVTIETDATRIAGHVAATLASALDVALDALAEGGATMGAVTRRLPAELRGAAAAPDVDATIALSHDEQPVSALERVLADMWCEVLGVSSVGRKGGFFALGGNSLAAMKLVSRVGEALHVAIPVRALFEAPTLATFAETIRRNAKVAGSPDRVAEILERISAMSDAEVGETLGSADRASAKGVLE